MNKAQERGLRASRAAARRAERSRDLTDKAPVIRKTEPFRVLIAVHRPRYRSRIERAVAPFNWETRSLLVKQDPIGLINQKAPEILVLSGDFGRNKDYAYLRAAQRYRITGMKIIALFETLEEAESIRELYDVALVPRWKSIEARAMMTDIYHQRRGNAPVGEYVAPTNDDDDEE